MKVCFAVCEYNPFHYGHLKHLQYIKNTVNPDFIVVVLSGNFTQRGEASIVDKYVRAKWAIQSGADAVIELPTVFATATAEIFADGAIKLINSVNCEKSICFGAETDNIQGLINLADLLNDEPTEMQLEIKRALKQGSSYVKARNLAASSILNDDSVLSYLNSPNNVLALEYVKAIRKNNYDIKINLIKRSGGDYNDDNIKTQTPSALAIRSALNLGDFNSLKSSVPPYVYDDLPKTLPNADKYVLYSLILNDASTISDALECAEGLENRIKSCLNGCYTVNNLINKLSTKRYTNARIRRILLSTALNVKGDFIKECLSSDLYLKVIAINKHKPQLLSVLSNSSYPIITRKSDADKLSGVAKKCFLKDVTATDVYSLITEKTINPYETKFI